MENDLGQKNITNSSKKNLATIYVLLGIILALAILFIVYKLVFQKDNTVGGIPQELILGSTADSSGFDLSKYTNGAEVEQYEANDNLSTLIGKYKTYFNQNGWKEVGNIRLGEEYQIVGENNAGERINVSIGPGLEGGGLDDSSNLQVTIIYQKLPY